MGKVTRVWNDCQRGRNNKRLRLTEALRDGWGVGDKGRAKENDTEETAPPFNSSLVTAGCSSQTSRKTMQVHVCVCVCVWLCVIVSRVNCSIVACREQSLIVPVHLQLISLSFSLLPTFPLVPYFLFPPISLLFPSSFIFFNPVTLSIWIPSLSSPQAPFVSTLSSCSYCLPSVVPPFIHLSLQFPLSTTWKIKLMAALVSIFSFCAGCSFFKWLINNQNEIQWSYCEIGSSHSFI